MRPRDDSRLLLACAAVAALLPFLMPRPGIAAGSAAAGEDAAVEREDTPSAMPAAPPANVKDPAALVRAAIEAHGGQAALAHWSDAVYEGRAVFTFGPSEISGSATVRVLGGKMLRRDSLVTFRGTPVEFVEGCTGRSAWQRVRGRVYDYPVDDCLTWLAHRPDILLHAAGAGPGDLTDGGESEVDGEPVHVVVFEEGGATTRILLDVATGLVRALEFEAIRNEGDGNPKKAFFKNEYSDYRDTDGVPFPWKQTEYVDGVRESVMTLEKAELDTSPEVEQFAKPAPDDEAREWGDQIAG